MLVPTHVLSMLKSTPIICRGSYGQGRSAKSDPGYSRAKQTAEQLLEIRHASSFTN